MKHFIPKLAGLFCLLTITCSANEEKINATHSPQPCDEITPDAGPRVSQGPNIFFTADFIYWLTRQDGLEYIVSKNVDDGKGSIKKPNFDWQAGFKAGFGWNTVHDGWDAFVQYTWLRPNHATDSQDGDDLIVFWQVANEIFNSDRGRAQWAIQLNAADGELGRNFYVSRFLKLRPFFGVKATWQEQNYLVQYTDTLRRLRLRQDQWGIGIRAGLNSSWQIDRYWCFYNNFALSGLWTRFDLTRKETLIENNIEQLFYNVKYDYYALKPVIEWGFGIRYDYWWSCDKYHVSLEGGWEEQLWIKNGQLLNSFFDSPYVKRGKDLFFHGLTIKGRIDF